MSRKGPIESATKFKEGVKKRGLDGNMWEIVKLSNNTQRWKPIASVPKGRKYMVHDNGGRPFLVNIVSGIKGVVEIYKKQILDDDWSPKNYTILVKRYTDVDDIFIGKSPLNDMTAFSGGHGAWANGNSILLKLKNRNIQKNRYVFIGWYVYEFDAPEKITKYYSSLGNSDVPYPVALSENYVYFMIGPAIRIKEKRIMGEFVPKSLFPTGIDWSDPYSKYYELFPQNKLKDRKGPIAFKNVKIIHERI